MAHHLLWTLLSNGGAMDSAPAGGLATPRSVPESPGSHWEASDDQGEGCHCSKSMTLLRALHIEGLPPHMTAAELSALMAPYGSVQYAEAAPEAVKTEAGDLARRLNGYVVFTDHAGACQAKRVLSFAEQMGAAGPDVLRVRFCKPQNVAPLCTPTFRAFVAAQWAASAAAAKAGPDFKKASCKVNALFVSKLHQHITTARLTSLFGKFGKMLACEVQYHSDGRSAGHGVVIYETIEDAEKALAGTNGYRLEGRTIEVTPLRLKKLPSKLEHLKNRIKRTPLSGDLSGSEDGSGSIPACSPKSLVGTPPTPAQAAALMGLGHQAAAEQQQQAAAAAAAAAALQLQQGLMHGLQLQQQQLMLHQVQQQMAMQAHMAAAAHAHMLGPQAQLAPANMAAAAAAAMGAPAGGHPMLRGGSLPLGAGAPGPAGMPHGGALHPGVDALHHPHAALARAAAGDSVPAGLDLSFIS